MLQAVLEIRAFPAGMELFPSADDEQWAFIQREIASSDYYIVIAAGKYGSTDASGVSFTEREYDYAVSLGKPVMGFLFHEPSELRGAQLEQDTDRANKLKAFRNKVARGRLVKFFRNPDELKTQVWHALTHAFEMRPQEGWTRAGNSRRLHDLEEISTLQKRILQLEHELASLHQDDGTADLSQGADPVCWRLTLHTTSDSACRPIEPPASEYVFATTWRELLAAIFGPRLSEATSGEALESLKSLLIERLRELTDLLHPSWPDRLFELSECDFPIVENWGQLFKSIRDQFFAVGYIQIMYASNVGAREEHVDREIWQITNKGRVELARATAMLRPVSNPESVRARA